MDNSEIIIQLHPNGRRFAIWTDALPLEQLGSLEVKRASNVEFNERTQEWEVTFTGETSPRFSHKSRSECVRWEVAYIQEHMTETMRKHFPEKAA